MAVLSNWPVDTELSILESIPVMTETGAPLLSAASVPPYATSSALVVVTVGHPPLVEAQPDDATAAANRVIAARLRTIFFLMTDTLLGLCFADACVARTEQVCQQETLRR